MGSKAQISILCLLVLFYLSAESALAQYHQVGSPIVSHFQKGDYSAGTQNWAAIQDARGIMFFGNNKGLLEFDGTTWRIYQLPNATIVRSMAVNDDGRIYIGGQDEFGYIDADEAGNTTYHSLVYLLPETERGFEDVWQIHTIGDQVLFYTHRNIYILEDETISTIKPSSIFVNSFSLDDVLYVQEQGKGLVTWENGLLNEVTDGDLFADSRIVSILPHDHDKKLIVTESKGIFLMDDSGIKPWNITASDFLINFQVYAAIELSDGKYAFGTTENGLLITEREGYPLLHMNRNTGLQNNTVLCLFEDKHQNLWLGLDNGIDYVENSAPFSMIGKEVGVEGTGYASVIYKDKLFLGTNQGLYFIDWPKSMNAFEPSRFEKFEGIKGQVWNLDIIDDMLFVSQHEEAVIFDGNRLKILPGVTGTWQFQEVIDHPNLAICGSYQGISLWQKEAYTSEKDPGWVMIGQLEGFNESARVMEQDSDGTIWISHAYKGLYRIKLDVENKKIEEVTYYNSKNGLPSDLFINVCKIRNELLFTTIEGVYKFDVDNEVFYKHNELNEIFGVNAKINRLISDRTGNIWFSVDDDFGMLKIIPKGITNEMEKIYFNQLQEKIMDGFEHVYTHDDRNVFIATEKGFISYDPSHTKDFHLPFETIVRRVEFLSAKDSIVFGGMSQNPPVPVHKEQLYSFPSHDNSLRFSFSTPFYEQINHIQYRHRLVGFQEHWSDWSTITQKDYTNLSFGNYRFEAEARNAYAQTSKLATFSFEIKPPWFQTLVAKLLLALLFILIFGALILYFARKTRRETSRLKIEQAQQIEQQEAAFKQETQKNEQEIIKLKNEKLKSEISHKNSQLASTTMHLVQKGEMLQTIQKELKLILPDMNDEQKQKIRKLVRQIADDMRLDDSWEQYEIYFDQVHENFLKQLREKFPKLTPKDQKLCAYLRMNFTTKEIAPLLNISVRGVEISRYRLRKKLNLDSETNLVDFLMTMD